MSGRSREAPTTEVQTGGPETLPNSLTAVTTTDTWIKHISFCNTTSGAVTVTVRDGLTGKYLLNALSVPANGVAILTADDDDYYHLPNGLAWSASASSSIDAELAAFKKTS